MFSLTFGKETFTRFADFVYFMLSVCQPYSRSPRKPAQRGVSNHHPGPNKPLPFQHLGRRLLGFLFRVSACLIP
jgi:hypothetical protein